MSLRESTVRFAALVAPWFPSLPAQAEGPCPPAVRLHGEGDLTARAKGLLSPAIIRVGPGVPAHDCPVTDAWLSPVEHGVMLVIESPWGVEARAVQSLELAVAILESWSVDAPTTVAADSGTRSSPIILEPEARDPPPVRRLSIAAQLELSSASGRSLSTGGSISAGPLFFEILRPFLSLRGASGFDFPSYFGPNFSGEFAPRSRYSHELELLVGIEFELRPISRFTLGLGAAGGLAWQNITQESALPGPDDGSRGFVDPRFELRTALGYALDDHWSIELSVSLAPVRDLSRAIISPPMAAPDYDGYLPMIRFGLGVRFAFSTPREDAES